LAFTWDFGEMNPFAESAADFTEGCEFVAEVVEKIHVASGGRNGTAVSADATKHPLPNDSASAVITDPPYYDSVPYAEISDYFYVWLKRVLAPDLPELFEALLTPKREQAIVWHPDSEEEAEAYVSKMSRAMAEARRVVAPSGICVLFFAHKSTLGWESQIDAMLKAGWVITGSWPIDTERGGRFNAQGAAALASSVQLVCRPRDVHPEIAAADSIGSWRDVLAELPRRIHEWMPRLAAEGVVGADAIFACLGPALEVFSRYSRVEKTSGDPVSLREYLEQVWSAVAHEALATVLGDADSSSIEPDARLSVIWLWTLAGGSGTESSAGEDDEDAENDLDTEPARAKGGLGFVLAYDAARKLAQGLGAELEKLPYVVELRGSRARLLGVAERAAYLFSATTVPAQSRLPKRAQIALFSTPEETHGSQMDVGGTAPRASSTTLDRVHQTMLLFGAGRGEALKHFVLTDGVGNAQRFWTLAQALSALYPPTTDEKRWIDGVLARKKGLGF
jgi:hypothetical protein